LLNLIFHSNFSLILQVLLNPLSDNTTISFEFKEPTVVSLKVINTFDEEVAALISSKVQPICYYEKVLKVANLPNELYICSLQTGDKIENLRIVVSH